MQTGKRQRRISAALVVQSAFGFTSGKKKQQTKDGSDAQSNPENHETPASTNVSSASISSKKSERPVFEVPPMGFGPIREPNHNDVLCGRGGLINGSKGNVQFRNIVATRKKEYNAKTTKRSEKAHIAAEIVREIRNMEPNGRFLRDDQNGLWFDIGDAKAVRKTGQALREAAPTIREGLEQESAVGVSQSTSSDGDDGKQPVSTNPFDDDADTGTKPASSPKVKSTKKTTKPKSKPESKVKKETSEMIARGMVEATSPKRDQDAIDMLPQVPQIHPMAMTMPRMKPGAVFSTTNSHRQRPSLSPTSSSPEHQHPEHEQMHYPQQYYQMHSYPQAQFHHPSYIHNSPEYLHHSHQHPYPMYTVSHHPSHYPPNMATMINGNGNTGDMPQSVHSNDAFGMAFFPPAESNLDSSDKASSVMMSDISALSSAMTTGDQRKQTQQQQQQQHYPSLTAHRVANVSSAEASASGLHYDNTLMAPPPAVKQDGSHVSMLDTTSSLPDALDNLSDVEMLSSTCDGALSSSATGQTDKAKAKSTTQKMSSVLKRSVLGGSSHQKQEKVLPPPGPTVFPPPHEPPTQLQSGCTKPMSALSGKSSDFSIPSSCGSLSNFSDTFMSMHLADQPDLDSKISE